MGAATILSVAQAKLNVQTRIKKQKSLRRQFSQVRAALQIILHDIVTAQDLSRIGKDLRAQRAKYFNLTASVDPDIAETPRLRERARADRDNVITELGYFNAGIMKEIEYGDDQR